MTTHELFNLIEQEKHSFARSQAIGFAEWCCDNGFEREYLIVKYEQNSVWSNRNYVDPLNIRMKFTSSDLYAKFLAHQAKQKEGGII